MSETGDGLVQVAYLHSDEVSYSWHDSMRRLYDHDRAHNQILAPKPLNIRASAGQLVPSRNYAVQLFLDKLEHEWMFFVDTDMGFEGDIIDRLLAVADPATHPVVGALCFALNFQRYDGMGGMRVQIVPTLYRIGKEVNTGHESFSYYGDYPPDNVTPVAATGAAALLMHRSALEKVRAEYGDNWFDQVQAPGGLVGEDFSFCLRLRSIGIPIEVHTGVQTTHHKQVWLGEDDYLRGLGAVGDDPVAMAAEYTPPATDPVAVLVPVLGRPDNAAPFMASLRASTGLATVYAICDGDDTDTADAWRAAGAKVLVDPGNPRTYARKVNLGYRETEEPWLFVTGDDVRFHPGWYDRAQYVAALAQAAVVGTNDLGNPRVMSGEHATHMLISRAYVDEFGASWDGPGVVAHEGYGHWYVDDELVTVAKDRGQWAAALDSIVEHLHPLWGKADDDDTYRLGQSHAAADRERFAARLAAHTAVGDAPAGV
jgi:hypothetical protein